MEGDEVLASMDSLWFYSSVFLQPSSEHKQQSRCPDELKPKQQQEQETHGMGSQSSCQAPRCVKEVTAVATERGAVPRSCRVSDVRVDVWLKKQRRRTKVVAKSARRCSPAPMPTPDDGTAMKAHLRSWAHAVACSVR